MKSIKKYVISLEKDSYRRELFFKQSGTEDFSLFYAVNTMGREYSELSNFFDIEKFKLRYGREPVKGEIGCALSHLSVYKKIFNDDEIALNDYCLVCEDDVLFSKDFFYVLNGILINNQTKDDFIILGQSIDVAKEIDDFLSTRLFSKSIDNKYYYAYPYMPYYAGTVCYLIKKSAIIQLLKHKPYWVADDYKLFDKSFGLQMSLVRPLVAIENPNTQSNLQKLRLEAQQQVLSVEKRDDIWQFFLKNTIKRDFVKFFVKKMIANYKSIKRNVLNRFQK